MGLQTMAASTKGSQRGKDDWRTCLVGGPVLGDVFESGDGVSFGVVLTGSSV